jgi:hypothetical protein
MDKISKHISYKEGVYSRTAERLGLKNDPSDDHLANMKLVAEKVFEPLRAYVGAPIKINSFYRGPDMYMYIKENLDFDQMIWEFGDDNNPNWVHVSYVSKEENRNRCLKAYKDNNNKTKYMVI